MPERVTYRYDYGSYQYLAYETSETVHEVGWKDPPDLEPKTLKAFHKKMKVLVEKEIALEQRAIESIKQTLTQINARIAKAMKRTRPSRISPEEAKEFRQLVTTVNQSIKRREAKRPAMWAVKLEELAVTALTSISKSLARSVTWKRAWTVAKCIAVAVVVIAAGVLTAVAVVATGGVALLPIAMVVVGSLTKVHAIVGKVRGFVAADKTTETALKRAKKDYLAALQSLREVHHARLERLDAVTTQLVAADKLVAKARREASVLERKWDKMGPEDRGRNAASVIKQIREFNAIADRHRKQRDQLDAQRAEVKAKLDAAIALTENDEATDAAIEASKESQKWFGRVGTFLDTTDLLLGGADAMSVAIRSDTPE